MVQRKGLIVSFNIGGKIWLNSRPWKQEAAKRSWHCSPIWFTQLLADISFTYLYNVPSLCLSRPVQKNTTVLGKQSIARLKLKVTQILQWDQWKGEHHRICTPTAISNQLLFRDNTLSASPKLECWSSIKKLSPVHEEMQLIPWEHSPCWATLLTRHLQAFLQL